MNRKVKNLIIALVVIALGGGFVAFNILNANRLDAAEGGPRNAPFVQWSYPNVQTIVSRVSARGSVELRERTIIFPETQAQIIGVHVSVGDVVEVGDLLITYDDNILETLHDNLAEANLALRQAQLGLTAARIGPSNAELLTSQNAIEQARSSISNIEAQLAQIDLQISQLQDNIRTAESTRDDFQVLFNNGVATRVDLDNAINAVRNLEDQLAITMAQRDSVAIGLPFAEEAERVAVAQQNALRARNAEPQAVNQAQIQQVTIEQAELRIAQIERTINDFVHEERATVAGTVLNVFVEVGELSVYGRPLLEIADVSANNLIVVVHVPENDAGGISLGQEVVISGGALGRQTYDGFIELIHPLAAPQQIGTTVETVVTVEIVPLNAERLRAGYTVDADIVTSVNEDTLVVPLMSTVSAGGGINVVYVVDENYILQRREVILGDFSDMYIEAIGIEATDMVVANPTPNLHEGMQVRLLQAADEAY